MYFWFDGKLIAAIPHAFWYWIMTLNAFNISCWVFINPLWIKLAMQYSKEKRKMHSRSRVYYWFRKKNNKKSVYCFYKGPNTHTTSFIGTEKNMLKKETKSFRVIETRWWPNSSNFLPDDFFYLIFRLIKSRPFVIIYIHSF